MAVNDEDRDKYPMIKLRHAVECLAGGNHDCNEHYYADISHPNHPCICGFAPDEKFDPRCAPEERQPPFKFDSAQAQSAFRVTVEDLKTGAKETQYVPINDYFLLATGSVTYSVQTYANGTHVITVKNRGHSDLPEEPSDA